MAHTSVRFISSMRGNLEIAKPFASPLIFLSFEAPHFLFSRIGCPALSEKLKQL